MDILRTPDECFAHLPDFGYAPQYVELLDRRSGQRLRQHYVDEGPASAAPVLLLHGEPSWSFLYRKLIPPLLAAGHRVITPDLIGFGRSDKPGAIEDYSFQRHVDWMTDFLAALDLRQISLCCQDWGGLIGLRLVAEQSERFARVLAANTFLPTGDQAAGKAFLEWQSYARSVPVLPVGAIVARGCVQPLGAAEIAAYDAPFPEERYKAGARAFPLLVPTTPDDPAAAANRAAWGELMRFERPFLTAFSDQDPITRGADAVLRKLIPGARGQAHTTLAGGGHFLQEDTGPALAQVLIDFIAATPS